MKTKRRAISALLLLSFFAIGGCSSTAHGVRRYARALQTPYAARQNTKQSPHVKQQSRNAGHAKSGRR